MNDSTIAVLKEGHQKKKNYIKYLLSIFAQ